MDDQEALVRAIAHVRKIDSRTPRLAMILGSGLNGLADSATEQTIIPGDTIPGYPSAGVVGHRGDLVIGLLGTVPTLFVRGRFHAYEGHGIDVLTFPVRLIAGLGATHLVLSNAAGSLREDIPEGSVMRITDYINMASLNPLSGISSTRSSVRSRPFDLKWGQEADDAAERAGISLKHGVYLWLRGPSYETPAEIRFFRTIGADAVGMSTVPEVVVANSLGLKVIGFSAITNLAAGLGNEHLSHEDVLEVGASINLTLGQLVTDLASRLDGHV